MADFSNIVVPDVIKLDTFFSDALVYSGTLVGMDDITISTKDNYIEPIILCIDDIELKKGV